MNDPIFDSIMAELDAAEARMDAAGVPPAKVLRVTCDWCGGDGTFGVAAVCKVCNGRGYIVTDAEDGA